MARRRKSVLELLVMAPWWVSVLVSVGAFLFVAYIVPAILGQQHRLLGPLAQQLPGLAPMVALVFLLPAPVSAFRHWRARLLHSQTGLDSTRAMSWQRFETLVAEAYRCAAYSVEETGSGGPDGGIDLIARKGGTFLVQCKQWKAYQVGVKEVRELFGLVYHQPLRMPVCATCPNRGNKRSCRICAVLEMCVEKLDKYGVINEARHLAEEGPRGAQRAAS